MLEGFLDRDSHGAKESQFTSLQLKGDALMDRKEMGKRQQLIFSSTFAEFRFSTGCCRARSKASKGA